MDKTTVLLNNVKQILIEFQVEVTKINVINDNFLRILSMIQLLVVVGESFDKLKTV